MLDNYKAKVVVFIFAIFIWFFVITENEYEHDIDVPIRLVNVSENMVPLHEIPENAKVKVRGNGKDLIALTVSQGARLELDLSDVGRSKTFDLRPKHVILSRPIGTIITKEVLAPDSLTVVLDEFTSKKVSVRPKIKTITAPGYTTVGEIEVTPDSIEIFGPKSLVTKINELYTKEEKFTDLRFDLKRIFPLAPLPSPKIKTGVQEVEVYVNVQKLLEKTVNSIPVEVRNAPKNVNITVIPSTLSLVLEGGGDLLSELSSDDIVAYIDYNRVKYQSGNEFPAVIERPQGISYRDVRPKTFKLIFERKQ